MGDFVAKNALKSEIFGQIGLPSPRREATLGDEKTSDNLSITREKDRLRWVRMELSEQIPRFSRRRSRGVLFEDAGADEDAIHQLDAERAEFDVVHIGESRL